MPEALLIVLLVIIGCESAPDQTESGSVAAVLNTTAMPTIFTLEWDSAEPAASRIEYGLEGSYDHFTIAVDSEDGLNHQATIALGAGGTWWWRVMDGDVLGQSGVQEVETPPAQLPDFSVTDGIATADGGYTLGTSPETPNGTAVWVIDSAGRYVWWAVREESRAEITEARVGADPAWIEWIERSPGQGIQRMRVDGSEEGRISLGAAHHDFVALEAGAYAAIERQEVTVEGTPALADGIVEIGPGGHARRIFTAADWLTFSLAEADDIGDGPEVVHGNGLSYDAATNRFYLSSWIRNSVMAIDRATGNLLWELGGPHSDFQLLGGTAFAAQHAPRVDDGGLMVFDNGAMSELSSRVVAYDVDETAFTYDQRWEDAPEPTIYTAVLGNSDRLDDGGLFISWGATGRVERLDADLRTLWRLDASLGGTVGYAHHLDTFCGSPG